jgi:hypothetical protein
VRALVLVALLGACSFEADYTGSKYRCGGNAGGCPPGFACTGGYCEVPGDADAQPGDIDAAPGGDADPDQPDAGPVDVCAEAAAAPAADTCADAEARDLTAAAKRSGGIVVYGDTTGYANDLGSPASYCPAINVITAGNDAIYTVELEVGDRITASLQTEGWDSALYLTPVCDANMMCLAGDDKDFDPGTMSQPIEEIVHTAQTAGRLYLLVDSVRLAESQSYAFGCFTLHVIIE